MESGTVVRLNLERGFGFISPAVYGADVFFHFRTLQGDLEFSEQLIGRRVEYETGTHNGRPCAVTVWAKQ